MTIILNTLNNDTPNTKAGSFIAVDGENTDGMGLMLMWNLRGSTHIETLRTKWAEAGLLEQGYHLPKDTSPHTALRSALDVLKERRVIVRPLEGRGSGWALVSEEANTEEVTHQQQVKACIDKDDHLVVTPYDHPLAVRVREEYENALNFWSVADLSYWLGSSLVVKQMGGLALKERGGNYYVRPEEVAAVGKVKQVLESGGDHSIYQIPMVKVGDGMRLMLDAALSEATKMADKMADQLAKGDNGKRALGNAQRKCDEMLAKLTSYDDLLGNAHDAVKQRIGELRGDAVATLLMLD